jgi:hypothetical protein
VVRLLPVPLIYISGQQGGAGANRPHFYMWHHLLIVLLIYSVASYSTYSQQVRTHPSYYVIITAVGIISSLLWCHATASLSSKQVIWFSLLWDFIIILVYNVIPFLMMARTFPTQAYLAFGMILLGLVWLRRIFDV